MVVGCRLRWEVGGRDRVEVEGDNDVLKVNVYISFTDTCKTLPLESKLWTDLFFLVVFRISRAVRTASNNGRVKLLAIQ